MPVATGSRWRLARVRGSQHVYTRPGTDVGISVPVHGNMTLKRGLQRHLMKLAGIQETDL
ncbi:type II toxin-antitoxin system HicA family toxin [Candidatus Spongiisocius sp.]|uniref:type II toxin-antitoxin system HicA family toxin n=1 Tax=Candidatus Spongiisocius sp. TaxID=3101273 RepID=UPI003B5A24F2